ncbi:hypothetical protein [Methylobacterium durans]|uniref:Uncharacterized protein n=1 Tax=Methylobacterium durans TaxID=2202825 RepID=A0A2U8WCL0_9HYPH|nr:hypothetical protein [Methylobacterium durans]AWN43341.1 hypothetical protein DK389_26075 [Methylobacterium durans]
MLALRAASWRACNHAAAVLVEAAIKDRGSGAKRAAACGASQAAIREARKGCRVSPRLAIKTEGARGIGGRLLCPEIFGTTAANGDAPPEPRAA